MKYLAAYCLLVLGGKASPSEDEVTKLLKDSGVSVEADTLKTVMKKLSGKSVPELIAEGSKDMQTVGGGGGGAAAATADAGAGAAADEKKEDKKKEEPEEEEAEIGGLFGDDDDY